MKKPFYLLVVLFLVSCMGSQNGIKISQEDFDSTEKNKHTRAQIVQRFGRPQVISTLPNGSVQIIYSYGRSELNPATCIPIVGMFAASQKGESVTASFVFDVKTNVLIDKSYQTTVFETGINR